MSELTGQQSCSTMEHDQIYNENNMSLIRLKTEGKYQIPLSGVLRIKWKVNRYIFSQTVLKS